jgi:predicted amidophosphoribosyltransferase
MSESLTDLGLALVCETCESEIDFDDGLGAEVGICRQCGMAFLVDVDEADAQPA